MKKPIIHKKGPQQVERELRAIYYYNVSSGYSCPVLETISIKDKQ